MFLPGDVHNRVSDLRWANRISMEDLAKRVGVSRSTISRIESGDVKRINAEVIKKMAQELEVSSDFLLGLSNLPDRQHYEVTQLGLSEGAVHALLSGRADVRVLNLLLENPDFADLTLLIRDYFTDTTEIRAQNQNAILDQHIRLMKEYTELHPEHASDIEKHNASIARQMTEPYEDDYMKITNRFLSAVRATKQKLDEGKEPQVIAARKLGLFIEQHIRDNNNGLVEGAPAEAIAEGVVAAMIENHPDLW